MTNILTGMQVKILTYGIYALMAFLTIVTGWAALQITSMPHQYVRLERYKEDLNANRGTLGRIEHKLDQLIMADRNKISAKGRDR